MANLRIIYDWLSFFLFVSILVGLWYQGNIFLIPILYAAAYSIAVIILGFMKADKSINKFFIVLGSLILPGIMPFIYYSTYLRGILKREHLVNEIKQKTLEELRNVSQS